MKQFEDGDPCFAPMLNALFAAFRGTAVMDGCEASATGTSRAVSITAGSAQVNGVEVAVGAGSVTLDAGGVFDRYDLISVNAAGSKIVTKGVAKRKCPTQPANTCLLAIVFVPAGATVIATGNVYDARMDAPRLSVLNIDAISSLSSSIYTSTNVKLLPINLGPIPKTIRKSLTGSRSDKGTVDLGTFTIPSEYIEGSIIGVEGWVQINQLHSYTASANIDVKVNGVTVKTFRAYAYGSGLTIKENFEDYIPIKGNDVISVTLVGYPTGSQYDIEGCSGNIVFFGEDVLPSVCVHPTW